MAKPRGCVGHEFVLRAGPSGGCHVCYRKYLSDPNIQILCANCHRIKTHDQVNKYKFGEM